ncbi:MAG: hypothetical protein U1F76_18045 [Candidatus Competibacteraceae bacterium]
MAIDVDQLARDITQAVSGVLNRDVTMVRGFSEHQVQALAQHAALIEAGITSGQITAKTRDFFLDSLEEMTLNFVKTLRGLLAVTVEKAWNAAVQVLWKAIETGTGLRLSLPGPEI